MEVVSADNPERDFVDKRRDYAEAAIPEYWIVDPRTETIAVLELAASEYAEHAVYRRGELAASLAIPELGVQVDDVFDAARGA